MITFIDDMIGRVLQALEHHGLAANTHVIFTSDHVRNDRRPRPGRGKPPMTYESVIRVPMLWAGPKVPDGRVHHSPMTHLDLVPTVIDLAGAPPLPGMEGRTFAPLLQGETDVHRDAVIVERIGIERHTSEPVVRQKILVTPRYKLAHYGSNWPGELYDLETDPEEFTNLWNDPAHAHIRAELTERLLTEIIDDELGDPVTIFLRQPLSPFGSFRDPRPPRPHRNLPPPHPQPHLPPLQEKRPPHAPKRTPSRTTPTNPRPLTTCAHPARSLVGAGLRPARFRANRTPNRSR